MTESPTGDVRPSRGPLVFISHDSRDAELAEALSKLLGSVAAGMLKTFRSSDSKGSQGFEYGVEWYPELMKTLESACDVVCLLTERGLDRPWLLYEAGVAKGKLDIPVHGLALGIPLAKASVGPFAQFQNCGDDVESITKLVVQLVQRLPDADPDVDTVRAQVKSFKVRAEELLAQQPGEEKDESANIEASPAKLFEEVKVMFQDLPTRLERGVLNVLEEDSRRLRHPRRPASPGWVEQALSTVAHSDRSSPGLATLVAMSFVRDEVPWLYEMAVESYRLSLVDPEAAKRVALEVLRSGSDYARMMPGRGLRIERDYLRTVMRMLEIWVERYNSVPAEKSET